MFYFNRLSRVYELVVSLVIILFGVIWAGAAAVIIQPDVPVRGLIVKHETAEAKYFERDSIILVTAQKNIYYINGEYDRAELDSVIQKGTRVQLTCTAVPNQKDDVGHAVELSTNGKIIVAQRNGLALTDILLLIAVPIGMILTGVGNIVLLCTFGVSVFALKHASDNKKRNWCTVPQRTESPVKECGAIFRELGHSIQNRLREFREEAGICIALLGFLPIAIGLISGIGTVIAPDIAREELQSAEITVTDLYRERIGIGQNSHYAYFLTSSTDEVYKINGNYDKLELLANVTEGSTVQIKYYRSMLRNFVRELTANGKTIVAYQKLYPLQEKSFFIPCIIAGVLMVLIGIVIDCIREPDREEKKRTARREYEARMRSKKAQEQEEHKQSQTKQ